MVKIITHELKGGGATEEELTRENVSEYNSEIAEHETMERAKTQKLHNDVSFSPGYMFNVREFSQNGCEFLILQLNHDGIADVVAAPATVSDFRKKIAGKEIDIKQVEHQLSIVESEAKKLDAENRRFLAGQKWEIVHAMKTRMAHYRAEIEQWQRQATDQQAARKENLKEFLAKIDELLAPMREEVKTAKK